MFEIKSDYRGAMAYQIYRAVGFLIAPFSILALYRGQYLLAIAPLLTAFLCLVNVYSWGKAKRFYIPPTVVCLFYIADILVVIGELGAVGAYWAFPTLLAIFWIHERRRAVQLSGLFFAGVSVTAYLNLDPETTARIAATLLSTAVFFTIAMGILEQQYEELKKLTVTDHLTGAYNRRYMDHKLDELIERKKRGQGEASLITLDIDHFKQINDRFGHSAGDRVLVRIVELIRSRVRVLDQVCRAGGEEFVIILPDTSEEQARVLGDELRLSISRAALLQGAQITVSCGLSGLAVGDNRDSWLRRSDQALYEAKRGGRNTVAVLDELQPFSSVAEAETG